MKQSEMNILVPEKLKEIEEQFHVDVLWAVESGSRAWGFASEDSDFDVRFIYKRQHSDYLKLNPARDVIELPIDDIWDVNGWDLDKTLKLLNKSNPTLYEWLNSPIRYVDSDFNEKVQPLMDLCFSEKNMLYHYLNTARKTIVSYLSGDLVKPKKYFYALRPVLACRWILAYHSTPPVSFNELSDAVLPEDMKSVVEELLDIKINTPEVYEIKPIRKLDDYLHCEMQETNKILVSMDEPKHSQWNQLNDFFYEEINTFGGEQ